MLAVECRVCIIHAIIQLSLGANELLFCNLSNVDISNSSYFPAKSQVSAYENQGLTVYSHNLEKFVILLYNANIL